MELRSASGFGASPSGAALPPQPPLHFTVHTVGQQLPHVVAFTDSKLDSRCSLVSHADSGAAINGITVARSDSGSVDVVLLAGGSEELAALRRLLGPTAFIVYWHQGATEDVAMRHQAFQHGANMVTHSELHLNDVLLAVAKQTGGGAHSCSYCGLGGLTPLDLYYHMPLYHTAEPNIEADCPACERRTSNLAVHVHTHHGPAGHAPEHRTGDIVLLVIRRPADGKFLMVQEFGALGFWLPGGGVDEGESLAVAAKREAMEEVGVDVKLVGTLEWKVYEAPIHNPNHGGNGGSGSAAAAQRLYRRFVTFYAEPADPDSCAPKTVPDFESVGACWVSVEELTLVPLRTSLPLKWFRYVAKGGVIHPLAIPDELAHAFESLPLF